jgi:glutathione synthase/RimK-type ligase-like ATP-grasp enzyme
MAKVAIVSNPASRARTIELRGMHTFVKQAPNHGHTAEIIDVSEFHRLKEFDAAFLRLDTSIGGLSFAASRYAWALGLRVIDDPRSMLTCMNKAHVQQLLERANIPTPETVLLTKEGREHLDAAALFAELGTPIVVKAPSSAFSLGVEKAHNEAELKAQVRRFAQQSDVILLQRFEPSAFDWRVGVLCGKPLYAARYHIPKGAWRIHDKPEGEKRKVWAKTERVQLEDVPDIVRDTALAACRTIGNGLYGVDLKQRAPEDSPKFGEILDTIAREGPRAGRN